MGWVGSGGMGGEERLGGRAGVRVCISIEIRGLSLSVTLVLIFFFSPSQKLSVEYKPHFLTQSTSNKD